MASSDLTELLKRNFPVTRAAWARLKRAWKAYREARVALQQGSGEG